MIESPDSHFTERMWLRAQRHVAGGRIVAARAVLESLINRQPGHVPARMLLASVHLNENRVRDAAKQALLASSGLPDDVEVVASVTQCLMRCGEMVAARDSLRRFDVGRNGLDGAHLRLLARTYQRLGDNTMALELMERAHADGYDNPDYRYFHGLQLQFHGSFDAARTEMQECLRLLPTYGRAALALARLSKRRPDRRRVAFIREFLRTVPKGTEEHAGFEFAQFEELEALGDVEEAFAALSRGNAIMHMRLKESPSIDIGTVDRLRHLATRAFVRCPGLSRPHGPIPIFIIGLPRSGTTVLDRMFDNHPDVVSTGERTDFPLQLRWCADLHGDQVLDSDLADRIADLDYTELGRRYLEQTQWRAGDSAFYVDKLPPNWLLAGLIHRALPFAPILHMVRAPMSVCFSNYKTLFGTSYAYSYDLERLAAHYGHYRRLMAHWHEVMPGNIMDVDYRQLVADPEETLSRVFAYCGLPPAAGCSDLTRNRTPVATMSCIQSREPLDTRGVDGWVRYRAQLEPIRRGLEVGGVRY